MRRRISGWTVGVSLVILAGIAVVVLWPKPEVAKEPVNFGGLIVPGESTWGDSVEDTTILHWEWAHCENDGSTVEMREVRPGCSINNSIFIADSIRRARFKAEQSKAVGFDWDQIQKAYEQAEDRRIERIVRKVLKEARPVKQIVDTMPRSTIPALIWDSIGAGKLRDLFKGAAGSQSVYIDQIRDSTSSNGCTPDSAIAVSDGKWIHRCFCGVYHVPVRCPNGSEAHIPDGPISVVATNPPMYPYVCDCDSVASLPIWEDLRKRRIEGRYPDSTGGVWVGVPKP